MLDLILQYIRKLETGWKGGSSKPIAAQVSSVKVLAKAGLLKGKKYASASESDHPYFEGSVYSGTGVVRDGNIITSGTCPFMTREDEGKDGTAELANALVKAIMVQVVLSASPD